MDDREDLDFVTYVHAPSYINNEGLASCVEPTTLMCGHEFSPTELDRCYRTSDEGPREKAFLDQSAGFVDYFGQRASDRKRASAGISRGTTPSASASFSSFLQHRANFLTPMN